MRRLEVTHRQSSPRTTGKSHLLRELHAVCLSTPAPGGFTQFSGGVRSSAGSLATVISGEHRIVLIDELEA
jgi:hypothetical protein